MMKKIGIIIGCVIAIYCKGQQYAKTCTLPKGTFISMDIPKEKWSMEITDSQLIETIQDGESKIFSTFRRAKADDCIFLMTVTKVLGKESEIKVGDRYMTTVRDFINNYLYIRTETKKIGVELILLKQK